MEYFRLVRTSPIARCHRFGERPLGYGAKLMKLRGNGLAELRRNATTISTTSRCIGIRCARAGRKYIQAIQGVTAWEHALMQLLRFRRQITGYFFGQPMRVSVRRACQLYSTTPVPLGIPYSRALEQKYSVKRIIALPPVRWRSSEPTTAVARCCRSTPRRVSQALIGELITIVAFIRYPALLMRSLR